MQERCHDRLTHALRWACASLAVALTATGHAATVCADGCDFTSIGAALTDAAPGEAVVVDPGTYTESDLQVSGRTLESSSPNDPASTIIDAAGAAAVISSAANATIRGFTITGGSQTGAPGGGIRLGGGSVTLENLIIENNESDMAGGGVGTNTGSSSLTMRNVVVRNNTARGSGGGVEWRVANPLTIIDSEITGNTVLPASVPSFAAGGGIYAEDGSTILIRDTQISGNELRPAQRNFGAGIRTSANSTTLENVTISGNQAQATGSQSQGGGVWFVSSGGRTLLLAGGSISGNSAGTSGGGVFCTTFVSGSLGFSAGLVTSNTPDELFGCLIPAPATGDTPADSEQSGTDADPVNTFTGDLFDEFSPDLDLGGPLKLAFRRYYSSGLLAAGVTGGLGTNWRHNFEWSLRRVGDSVTVVDSRGRLIEFDEAGGSWGLTGNVDVGFQLVEAGGTFTLFDPRSRLLYGFDAGGRLASIADGKGNVLGLSYSGDLLTQVADGLGRVLDFVYQARRLTTLSDGTRTVTFGHTGDDLASVTHADGAVTRYTYDPGGLLNGTVRPEGNTPFTQTWDAGQVATQSDAAGNTHAFDYAGADTTMTAPDGGTRVHTHSIAGELLSRTDQLGNTFTFASDVTGRRQTITDRLGAVTTYGFDSASGLITSIAHADGTTTAFEYAERDVTGITFRDLTQITYGDGESDFFEYDAAGNLVRHTDREGFERTATFNARGQAVTVTNALGGTTTHTYNADGTRATTTDPAGNETIYDYDPLRRLTTVTLADGNVRTLAWDDRNRLTSTTNGGGSTVSLDYDGNGRIASTTDALGGVTTIAWDDNDRWTGDTDPTGARTARTYDALGRIATDTDEHGTERTRSYDALGRLAGITDGRGNTSGGTYDAEGVVDARTDRLGRTTDVTTDPIGRVTSLTTPLGRQYAFAYDASGRMASSTNPLGDATTFSRDARGLLTGVTLPGGTVDVAYALNGAGQTTALTDGNGNVWQTGFDTLGRKLSTTDPLGNLRTFTHDARNRTATVTLPDRTSTVTVTYDGASNPTRVSYSDGTVLDYIFDAQRRLTGGTDFTRTFDSNGYLLNSNGIVVTRDPGGRLESVELATDRVVTYTYDANDNVTRITDWSAAETEFTYDAEDRLTTITRPNGVVTTLTYDADGRLTGVADGALSTIALTRDAASRITSAVRDVPLPATVVIASDVDRAVDAASQITAFTYDDMGRRTGDGAGTYTWDLASRLTGYDPGSAPVTLRYDALGRRIERTAGGTTTAYVWNDALGLPSVSIVREAGEDAAYFVHTPGGRLVYRVDASTDERRDYHFDEMGNTLFLTDAAGTVTTSYAHTPYGRRLAQSGADDNPFTWQGEFGAFDDGNGLYYLRARYYGDGGAGRCLVCAVLPARAVLRRDDRAVHLARPVPAHRTARGQPVPVRARQPAAQRRPEGSPERAERRRDSTRHPACPGACAQRTRRSARRRA